MSRERNITSGKKWNIEQNVFSRIRVENIEANSIEEASKKAKKIIDERFKGLGPNVMGQPFFIEGKNTTFFLFEREIYLNEKDGTWRDVETDELIEEKDQ